MEDNGTMTPPTLEEIDTATKNQKLNEAPTIDGSHEFYEMVGDPEVPKLIKQKLQWAGHFYRG